MGYQEISNEINIPFSTIRAIIQKWKEYSLTTGVLQNGRLLKVNSEILLSDSNVQAIYIPKKTSEGFASSWHRS